MGKGRVILTTPHHLQPTSRGGLLQIATHLLDWLHRQYAPALVSGPAIEYIVNRGAGKDIVTLVNNSGVTWSGTVTWNSRPASFRITEYITEKAVPHSPSEGAVDISAEVPPYDLRVFALESM
jgi:hypothetical protein